MLPVFRPLVWGYATHFTPVGAAFYTTSRVNAPRFSWCRRYAAHFTAVGDAFCATARVNAVRVSAVGVGVALPILVPLVQPSTVRRG